MKKHILFLFALVGSLAINVIFMKNGIFNITQHLYYVPVLLGVFFYGKSGVYLAGITALLYLATNALFDYSNAMLLQTVTRCSILIAIAILVYILTKRNKEQEKDLLEEQKWLETTLLSIGDGVIAVDISGVVRMVNKEAEIITGYEKAKTTGKNIKEVYKVYRKQDDQQVDFHASDILESGSIFQFKDEVYFLTKDGLKIDLELKISAILLPNQEILGFVIVFRDITLQNSNAAEIVYLTYHDKLTGLYNRRFFEAELKRLDVVRNLPVSVIIGDVNGLKLTNDAFGHLSGDNLLVAAGNAMQEVCREDDIVARWGGDEYIILLPNTGAKEAEEIADRIRKRSSEKNVSNISLSISLGCATKTEEKHDIMKTIKQADDSMYKSKLLESRSIKGSAVQSILSTLHEKDDSEETHSIRVSELCGKIGQAMLLDKRQITDLTLLGRIHDIGKISIDQSILSKVEKLTLEEYEVIKQHSEKGYHIISASPELSYLAGSLLAHHERFDGTGYPNGLSGQNIPLMSRILSVADAFEAMTGDKPYHKAISKADAIKELVKFSGTQFDPEVVKAFAAM